MKLWHKGACGDILYSWMYASTQNGVDFSVPRMGWYEIDQFAALERLAKAQSYLNSFTVEDVCPPDAVDMRYIVDVPKSAQRPTIIQPYFHDNGAEFPGYQPWIFNVTPPESPNPYCVVNLTARYRTNFAWGPVLPAGEMRFIGLPDEFNEFQHHLLRTGYHDAAARLIHYRTADLYEAAQQIMGADAFFGNASSCLALAQGLGVPNIIVEFDANTVNTCRFGHERHINAV